MWGRCGRNVKDIPSVVGRENVWNLAIADDLVIVEKSEKRKYVRETSKRVQIILVYLTSLCVNWAFFGINERFKGPRVPKKAMRRERQSSTCGRDGM
jgi:hypothetical protein